MEQTNNFMKTKILVIWAIAAVALTALLAGLKLAGIISLWWVLVTAPIWGSFALASIGFTIAALFVIWVLKRDEKRLG